MVYFHFGYNGCKHSILTVNKIHEALTELQCIDCHVIVGTWERITKEKQEELELAEIQRLKDIEERNRPVYYYDEETLKEMV